MKPQILILFLLFQFRLSGQINFFKKINDVEAGSYPSNFIEFKGDVYFFIKTLNGNELWKTLGSEENTVKFSNKKIAITNNSSREPLTNGKNFLICNNELYYCVINVLKPNIYEIWKTDGISETYVNDGFNVPQFCLNNTPIIETNLGLTFKDIPLADKLIHFESRYNPLNNRYLIDIKKRDFQNNDELIASVDSTTYFFKAWDLYESNSYRVNNFVYFFVAKELDISYNGNGKMKRIELWKTDGNSITKIKKIIDTDTYNYNFKITSLSNFNGKLIFLANSELWISDGTDIGTNKIGNTSWVNSNNDNVYGFFDDKFIFSKSTDNDYELWVSDGSPENTYLLKDLYPNQSSNPNSFEKVGNKIFFKTSKNELWQTDGTEVGTIFLLNIPFPANQNYQNIKDSFIYTTDQKIFFSYYTPQQGYELWSTDGTIASMKLLKNIVSNANNDFIGELKVKMGGSWYFNSANNYGVELWKSDGTSEGTKMIKDIIPGFKDTYFIELVNTNNLVFFTTFINNEYVLYRSDGTFEGTFQLPIISDPRYQQNIKKLTIVGNRLFFMVNNDVWVTDGTFIDTYKVVDISFLGGTPQTLVACGNNCLIYNSEFFLSDGIVGNTKKLFDLNDLDRPNFATCFINFKEKAYFLGRKYNQNSSNWSIGIFETDGTKIGTRIVKTFNNDNNFLNSTALFLEKTEDKLFFRANYMKFNDSYSFDLWSSDGTETGTNLLKTVQYNSIPIPKLKFSSIEKNLFINIIPQYYLGISHIWFSDGTPSHTLKILEHETNLSIFEVKKLNQKYYFSLYKTALGTELWETDGTIAGTKLSAEIRTGQPSSQIDNLMDFDDKLLMTGTNGTAGLVLWQYTDPSQIKSIKSGNWDDPTTWSTGVVPANSSNVTIEAGHTVTIPAAINANLFTIIIKMGGILEIGNGSSLILNNQN